MRRCKGIALVSVLWIVALLSVVATGLSASVRSESRLVANTEKVLQAQFAVESGVELAALNLMYPQSVRWPEDGSIREVTVGDARLRIATWNVTGKVDINAAPMPLLRNLLLQAGVDTETAEFLADAILDWRDRDDFRNLNGAEDTDYRIAGMSWGAKDAPFESIEELRLVLGMTDQIYAAIENSVTVFSGQSGVNLQHASAQVVAALAGLENLQITSGGTAYAVQVEARIDDTIVSQADATINVTYSGLGKPYSVLQWTTPQRRLFPDRQIAEFEEVLR
jgi:general secretion pathway protein K